MRTIPKLAAPLAQKAAEQDGTFSALDAGLYTGRLAKVEAKPASTGNPMWVVEFDDIRDLDGRKKPGKQWVNLVHLDNSMWKVKQFFDAFGYETNSDTDEMLGERCRLNLSVGEQLQGKNAGQLRNNIETMLPLLEGDYGYGQSSGGGGGGGASPARAGLAAEEF